LGFNLGSAAFGRRGRVERLDLRKPRPAQNIAIGSPDPTSPRGRVASVSYTSFALSRSPFPSTQARIASRSCGLVTPSAMRTESWVRTSLFSLAGRCVIDRRRKP
jgi:hypothetical protein